MFGFINRLATFLGDSYKRMLQYTDQMLQDKTGQEKFKRLQKLCPTRWWAKEKALLTIFESGPAEEDDLKGIFTTLAKVLLKVSSSDLFDSKTSSEAHSLLQNLTSYSNILTAHLFLKIFDYTGPASRYLQTRGLDYVSAWKSVESAKKSLTTIELEEVVRNAERFVEKAKEVFECHEDYEELSDMLVSTLPAKRVSRKKKMPGEESADERVTDPLDMFRVEVFRRAMDQINTSIEERFSNNYSLVKESALFDPRNFGSLKNYSSDDVKAICERCSLDKDTVFKELTCFAACFDSLVESLASSCDGYRHDLEEEIGDDDDVESSTTQPACKKCFGCCFSLLYERNFHTSAYSNIFLVYEYLLTLSFTQVSCERAFSKLKLIKTRLRSSLSQDRLEAFMLMSVERELLESVKFQSVVDVLVKNSSEMKKLLVV